MARMSIDDMVVRDPRVAILAKLCGWNRYETLGHLLEVWSVCYDRVTPLLSELVVDASANLDGFAKHLVAAELASITHDGRVRIAGVEARIEYLEAKARAGRKGGIKSGESRRNQNEAKAKQRSKQREARPNPIPNTPDSAPDPVPASAPVPAPVQEESASPPARAPSGPHQEAIAEFDAYYQRTHGGSRPTWKGKNAALVAQLVKAHGLREIVRRIHVLETSPPSWPAAPWDLPTFVQHFDKVAVASGGRESALDVALRLAGGSS